MEEKIKTPEALKDWFFSWHQHFDKQKKRFQGVFVSSRIRREVMCSDDQAKIIIDGKVMDIKFENLGGGVFRAFIERTDYSQNPQVAPTTT